jgi:transcriptional regulator with XRE-family HTH domain
LKNFGGYGIIKELGGFVMLTKWTLGEKLADLRNERKLYLRDVEEATGIPLSTLQRMESDPDMRTGYQDVITLAKFYGVSTDYLFCLSHTKMPYNQELSELGLTEKVIEILKNRSVNNRLVCEFIEHPDFANFICAMELYIDRKIMPHTNTLHAMYKMAENSIVEDGKVLGHEDVMEFVRQTAVDEDSYLRYRITECFNSIIRDLFDKHKKDPLVLEQQKAVEDMAEDLNFYLSNSDKSRAKLAILAKRIGLNISSLTDDETKALIKALNNSKVVKAARAKKKRRQG